MRYSRHKRSGISYGCHNESPRTTPSCHKRSCFAISYPLSRIYCRCRMYRRFGFGMSADNSSLLPPPNRSSMAMQVNMLVHTLNHLWQQSLSTHPSPDLLYANEIHTLNHLWQQSLSTHPSPDLLYANEIFPHTLYGNEIFPHLPPHTHTPRTFYVWHLNVYHSIPPPHPHAPCTPVENYHILVLQNACFTIYNNNIPFHMVLYFHP